MSGIFGVTGDVDDAQVRAMAARLAHRGAVREEVARPGVRGGVLGKATSLASTPDGRWVALADASIFNAEVLSSALDRGARSRASSPAALILELYTTRGPAAIESVEGDFVAVIVDTHARATVLCRDFFGCRPLYYAALPGGGVAFASEYKALLALEGVPAEPDVDMLQHLQSAKRLAAGRTLLKGVRIALPGAVMALSHDARERTTHTFAPLGVSATVTSEREATEVILSGLRASIERRTRDLDRVGVALSGGIDSIGMAFLIREVVPNKPLYTYTAGADAHDPEIVTARIAADLLGSTHREVLTPPTMLEDGLSRLVWHMEDPVARTEALQLLELAQVAAGDVDVVFSGQGADGAFGGMPRHLLLALMKRLRPLRRGLADFYTFTQLGLPPHTVQGRLIRWAKFRGALPPAPRVRGGALPKPIELPPIDGEFVNTVMSRGFQAGVSQDLPKFERTFSSAGLVHRAPFCDVPFVRSAFRISDELKIKGVRQKYILRRAFGTVVPAQFQNLKKLPQRMRIDAAFSDALVALASRVLTPEAIRSRNFFSEEDLQAIRAARRDGRFHPEAAARLWTLILTELWAQRFLDERGAPPGRYS